MCEWEQECSDNPLLFDPIFARQYIKERKSWLINKQSICAKCKLQLGEHLLDNQAASSSIHHQCHDFSNSDKIPAAKSDENNVCDIKATLIIIMTNKLYSCKIQEIFSEYSLIQL